MKILLTLMENSFQLFVRMQNCSKEDLTTAKDFCLANPEQKCLVVCLELFTFHTGDDEGNEMAVYMSLFADGCAAVVLSGDYGNIAKDKWAIEGSYSYLIPDCPNQRIQGNLLMLFKLLWALQMVNLRILGKL